MIRFEDVAKIYGTGATGFEALGGVSFQVRAGEFVAVVGPSGCGKSTLLNILGLLDQPSRGLYALGGREVGTLGDGERSQLRRVKIGFVFQSFNLLPRFSALENVALPMSYAGMGMEERRARAAGLLDRVGLKSKSLQTPLELSGGERQRVSIARALANSPDVILADEPTGNLDSRSSAEILGLIRELHAQGKTVFLVTHDPGIASSAERVLSIKDGRIIEDRRR
ncbi:MAG: macrolide ABC transporter ATP-binding protein [Elusimicrobia bacterium RIFCSPLOWO2_12_FULL_59_9]|nr:MAG: macrolide ABC transporter ATP-binding protein [Elusimicrobia bacterium RIFCSPLOWO2_12_FULL_59_9]